MKTAFLVLAAAAAVTVAPAAAQPSRRAAPESIRFEAGPCFGACPIYKVTVRSDGTGTFEGINFTAVRGTRDFRLTARQYRAFARHLAPVRPARGSLDTNSLGCRDMITDMPSAAVTWTGRRGTQSLHHYYGCDPRRNGALARRLSSAPDLLPIRDYIGAQR
jgi:hypothetical protein